MGLAPRPGAGDRRERARQAKRILRITVKGESWDLAPDNLPFEERTRVRKQTGGMAFETYWETGASIGPDSIVVLWWLARRAGGEKQLALHTVWSEWEQLLDDGLDEGDIEVEEITPDADEETDSPES